MWILFGSAGSGSAAVEKALDRCGQPCLGGAEPDALDMLATLERVRAHAALASVFARHGPG